MLLFRLGLLCLVVGVVAGAAWADVVSYAFDADVAGFTVIAGKGALTRETAAPLAGAGSLRCALDEGVAEVRFASPAFAVKPWTIYRLSDKRNVPAGMTLLAMAQFAEGDGWRDVTLTIDGDGWTFGTLPAVQRARLVYVARAEKATDRFVTMDTISVAEHSAMMKERGTNLFSDPSLEAATKAPPAGWDTWVNAPEKTEIGARDAHHGKQYYRVTGNTVYLVLPVLTVQPNRLYRIRFWVRGEGQIYFGLHKLAPKTPKTPDLANVTRAGWSAATPNGLLLKPDTWQPVEMLVATDSESIRWLNPYMNMKGTCTIEIDDLEAVTIDDTPTK